VRHVRMLGLCLVAALALGAYAVSSASALEWGKCEKLSSNTGLYSGPNCTKAEKAKPKGTGEYEWRKATEVAAKRVSEGKSANVPFSGHSVGGGGVLTTAIRECEAAGFTTLRVTRQKCKEEGGDETLSGGGAEEPLLVECANETNTGEAAAKANVTNVHVVFKGCAAFGSFPCTSASGEEGEVDTTTLKGKLGWIDKSSKEVGVLLEPAQKHGAFAEFVCGELLFTYVGVGNKTEGAEYTSSGCFGAVPLTSGCPGTTPEEEKHGGYDGIISPITPVNRMTNEYTQVYSQEAAFPFRNIPSQFEGKHVDVLEDYITIGSATSMFSAAGEAITNTNTPEEEGEIRA
jgi:hypothetical protein